MTTKEIIDVIFRDPRVKYNLSEFDGLGKKLEEMITIYPKAGTGKETGKTKYFLKPSAQMHSGKEELQVSNDDFTKTAPEEIVRQLWVYKLLNYYSYKLEDLKLEVPVTYGSDDSTRFADIVVYSKDGVTPRIVFEIKKPNRKDGIDQLKSYMESKGSPIAVWSNGGSDRVTLYRPYPKDYDTLDEIPRRDQAIEDVIERKRTLAMLKNDFNFKKILENIEELALANYGDGVFDEIFKLIFAKIYDEIEAEDRPNKEVFFASSKEHQITYDNINNLFQKACEKWQGIFKPGEKIELKPSQLSQCIGLMSTVRLMGSNLRIMDDAFEYLIPSALKKKDGQFFTPRHVIDLCVRMLNPKPKEYIMDPSCGSAGFLLHAMEWVYPAKTEDERFSRKHKYAAKYLWGVDISEKSARTSRALMLIAGDGHTNIFGPRISSLDPADWLTVQTGQDFMRGLRQERLLKNMPHASMVMDGDDDAWEHYDELMFDIVLANPPFAGEIKDRKTLAKYQLAKPALKRAKDKTPKEERDVLFIERIIKMLKPGGRAAIVLPQGKFNNSSLAFIREWILRKARLLAVVGLHPNTFKPHTGTKTSVLVIQKYKEEELKHMDKVKETAAKSCPDFSKQIKELLQKYQKETDVPEEDIPENIMDLLIEEFPEEESEEMGDEASAKDGEAEEVEASLTLEEQLQEADEQILDIQSSIIKVKQQLLDLEDQVKVMDETQKKELSILTESWKGEKKELSAKQKQLKEQHKLAIKELKDRQKEGAKQYKAQLKSLEIQLPAAIENKLKLSYKGKLELVLNDADRLGKLNDRFIDAEVAKKLDYPIFMAVSEDGGKDNSGEYIYLLDTNGNLIEDELGNPVIKQDLVSYDIAQKDLENIDKLPKEKLSVAEHFIKYAKHYNLKFWS